MSENCLKINSSLLGTDDYIKILKWLKEEQYQLLVFPIFDAKLECM
jgi:hypothetical protein